MNKTSNKYYNDRRPSISVRVSPETKAELVKIKNDNGMTLSDATEEIISNGLNNHNNSNSLNVNNLDADSEAIDWFNGQLNEATENGFNEASKKAIEELEHIPKADFLKNHPNSVLAKEINDDGDDVKTIECGNCHSTWGEGDDDDEFEYCPYCSKPLDNGNDDGEENGILSGLFKWNNGG